jgi:choline dehydrogenase-like flavoprotein
MERMKTDVLVIGSGFGAAGPAMRLSEAGVQVTMLEKGPDIDPDRDFRQTQDPRYLLKYIKGIGGDKVTLTYVEGLGGGSGFYELISLRAPSKAFAQVDHRGRRLWPGGIDRPALDPWYDVAEDMLNINQIAVEDVPQSGIVFSKLMKNLGYSCDRAPYAVVDCQGDGYCSSGCVFGAKQTLHGNYLQRARRAGLEIRTDCEALEIRARDEAFTDYADSVPLWAIAPRYEVRCRDGKTGVGILVETRVLILAGGTVGTAKLLLQSDRMIRLGNQVGRNVATNGSVKAAGIIPDDFPDADMVRGRSHPGMISYEFLDSHGIVVSSHKPLPLFIVAAARLVAEGEKRRPDYWGRAHLDLMRSYRHRMVAVYALGLEPPNTVITLDDDGKAVPKLDLDDRTRKYCAETRALLDSLFSRNGGKVLEPSFVDREGRPHGDLYFSTGHMVGSARMAESRKTGVVDAGGEAFAYPGLYVTDGAAIPSSLAVNTSLTILANSERIADRLCRRYAT